jgi:nitrogen fixation protein NifX
MLNANPAPWLRKILSKGQERVFDFEEENANG